MKARFLEDGDEEWKSVDTDRLCVQQGDAGPVVVVIDYNGQIMVSVKGDEGFESISNMMEKDSIGMDVTLEPQET